MRSATTLVALAALGAACAEADSGGLEATLSFSSLALPNGQVSRPYSATLEVRGGTGPVYDWTLLSNNLPDGLELVPQGASALVRGIPTEAGLSELRLLVVDADTGIYVEGIVTLEIEDTTRLAILPDAIPTATVGQDYVGTIRAVGGSALGYRWSLVDGALPPGLRLGETGTPDTRITGTTTVSGNFDFTVAVEDSLGASAGRAFTLFVDGGPGPLRVATRLVGGGVIGAPFELQFVAEGGRGAVTWTSTGAISGTTVVPDGRVLTVAGRPDAAGFFFIEVEARDAAGATATAEWRQRIVPRLQIQTEALTSATTGAPYPEAVVATAGAGGHMWRVLQGQLPDGLELDPTSERLGFRGTPTGPERQDFVIEVRDAAAQTATRAFSLEVVDPIEVLTTTLAVGRLGERYLTPLEASGGRLPLRWLILRGAPPGVEIDPAGQDRQSSLHGVAGRLGSFAVVVQVIDADGRFAGRTFLLEVVDSGVPLAVQPAPTIVGTSCEGFSAVLRATGGANFDFRWRLIGAPPGVEIDPTGTPTVAIAGLVESGAHTFEVEVSDANSRVARGTVTVDVGPPRLRPRYAAGIDRPFSSSMVLMDTCRRTPAALSFTRSRTNNGPEDVQWSQDLSDRRMLVRGTFTSTNPGLFVTAPSPSSAPLPLEPVGVGEWAPGRAAILTGGSPARVVYESARGAARFVSLTAPPYPDAAAHGATATPTRIVDVSADGRWLAYGDSTTTISLSAPGRLGLVGNGIALSTGNLAFPGFDAPQTRAFFLNGTELRSATLPASGSPVISAAAAGSFIGARMGPRRRRVLITTNAATGTTYGLVDITVGPPTFATLLAGSEGCGRRSGELEWSPDGSYVSCIVPNAAPVAGARRLHVWRTSPITGTPIGLMPSVPAGAVVQAMHWGPNGRWLIVQATLDSNLGPQLYLLSPDQPGAMTRLTTRTRPPNLRYRVAFSPDGARAALDEGDRLVVVDVGTRDVLDARPGLRLPAKGNPWRHDSTGLFAEDIQLVWLDLIVPGQPSLREVETPPGRFVASLISQER